MNEKCSIEQQSYIDALRVEIEKGWKGSLSPRSVKDIIKSKKEIKP